MTVPVENVLAASPRHVRAWRPFGPLLRAPTVGDAIALGALDVDFARPVRGARAFLAAALLAGRDPRRGCRLFLLRCARRAQAVERAVDTLLDAAFATRIPVKSSRKAGTPSGLGWPLSLAEFLCAEYGWHFNKALSTPLATAFALEAAASRRNGAIFAAPDYIEREYIAKRQWPKSSKSK